MSRIITPVAELQHRLSRRRRKGRYGVLLLRWIPDSWKPNSPQGMPRFIESAKFIGRGLKAREACIMAQAYNLAHIDMADRDGTWAVVVSPMFAAQTIESQPCTCEAGKAVANA
jgi:hypothetical protein